MKPRQSAGSSLCTSCATSAPYSYQSRSDWNPNSALTLSIDSLCCAFHVCTSSRPGSAARNPAFDVTPTRFVTGYVTERGVFGPGELPASVFPAPGQLMTR